MIHSNGARAALEGKSEGSPVRGEGKSCATSSKSNWPTTEDREEIGERNKSSGAISNTTICCNDVVLKVVRSTTNTSTTTDLILECSSRWVTEPTRVDPPSFCCSQTAEINPRTSPEREEERVEE
jgi:hypothetical protein